MYARMPSHAHGQSLVCLHTIASLLILWPMRRYDQVQALQLAMDWAVPYMYVLCRLCRIIHVNCLETQTVMTALIVHCMILADGCCAGKSHVVSCAQIYGAVTLNNTLCLGVFLLIVHYKRLTWTYTSEVATLVGVYLPVHAQSSEMSRS